MAKIIKISKWTSISDLSEKWCAENEDEVVFEISQESSFMLFVEGIALGYLQNFILAEKKISIRFHHACKKIQIDKLNNASPKSLDDLVKSNAEEGLDLRIPKLLCGIFGLQLLYHSYELRNAFDPSVDTSKAQSSIREIIWNTYTRNNGLLGDGKSQYLVAEYVNPIPKILKQDKGKFLSPEFFRAKIFEIMINMIYPNKRNKTRFYQDILASWVYNMAENSYDHGCYDFQKYQKPIKGFNGILIQKIATQNRSEVIKRTDLDEKLRQYILRLYQDDEFVDKHKNIIAITVMDSGNGIHNTLGDQYISYTDIERLNEAYKRGVTRHRVGKGRAGYGLPDSVRMAKNSKAYISVCSGNIYSSKTFEELEDESIRFDDNYQQLEKSSGTSQSIILPVNISIIHG